MSDTMTGLKLKAGQRLRTAGTTYEVSAATDVPAGFVPVAPQATRLLKVQCSTCGYVARVTKRWIDKAGAPVCPTDRAPMIVDSRVPAAFVVPDVPAPARRAVPAPVADPPDSREDDENFGYDVDSPESELARLVSDL
jgi:hypothetical protein